MPRKPKPSNPNGANQYLYDPRQELCWEYYINPESETFSNAYASAKKSKYEEYTAKRITSYAWFEERVRRMNLLGKAEKVLNETVEMETFLPVIGMFGPIIDRKTKKPLFKHDDKLLTIKQRSATFIAERLGKKKGYSTRTELTGADGKDLPQPIYGGKSTSRNNIK